MFSEDNPCYLRVRIFHDRREKLIGLKPDEEGYKITTNNSNFYIKCTPLTKIVTGAFYPKWDNVNKMLIFGY